MEEGTDFPPRAGDGGRKVKAAGGGCDREAGSDEVVFSLGGRGAAKVRDHLPYPTPSYREGKARYQGLQSGHPCTRHSVPNFRLQKLWAGDVS